MSADAKEAAFQQDIINGLLAGGWQMGSPAGYDRARALYTADCLAYIQSTQPKSWAKYQTLYPSDPEAALIDKLTTQLAKSDPQAIDRDLRTFGTLGVLRHELRDRSVTFKLCQFKPEHSLNPETAAMYAGNILRVVPELVYSPYASTAHFAATGTQAKAWRIDLVLFLNGIPIVTLELKSEFKQTVERAIKQYKMTRLPKDPATNQPEPLLTFKRGALVHFAVSQYEVYMTTRLAGNETRFLPFNRGKRDGGAGNETPDNLDEYATAYLWTDVLAPANLLEIIGRFIHLEITEEEDWQGRKRKKENLIFPRYHQWDLVKTLIETSRREGPGHKYLVQHSAGSGKSNSIAWTAHQLASLYDDAPVRQGQKLFDSVIVVTDRTVLDNQLQETISQFEHASGVIGLINREEGQGSKSEKLATALEQGQPIIIVTIQTFPFVLKAIEDSATLQTRRYAIIADEAHSSQTGRTAGQVKAVLTGAATGVTTDATSSEHGDGDEPQNEADDATPPSAEDLLNAAVEARRAAPNLSYYAFTATPKPKTLELFGRPANPAEPASKRNKPQPFHVYSMRQAIEEGYILDVLRNYTSYRVAYQLARRVDKADTEVESKKAKAKIGQWVRLHDYNIAQKVMVIVEHFRGTVMGLLNGQAKAMVVTGSRKEAVRFKLEFDKYVAKQGYHQLNALVAFSGEVTFHADDPNSQGLVGEKFSESSMNPGLRGRDLREVFKTTEYQVMIAANKFQTGFDQPKLCAMYVDKKLGGVDCVQTLSRLNRVYPGKLETYVLDFFNDPQEVLKAFQEYYQTAALLDVSDPNHIWDLFDKLRAAEIFLWSEVIQFNEVFYTSSKSNAALSNLCKPALDRWQQRYAQAEEERAKQQQLLAHAKAMNDAIFMANTETELKIAQRELDALGLFKADLMTFTRYYEFMSQIVDYDSRDLEMLSLYARHLAPLLREKSPDDDPIDLSSVELSHYRLSKTKQQDLRLVKEGATGLSPAGALGTGRPRNKEEILLSELIVRLNELFITDGLTNSDLINYAQTIADKVLENTHVMNQVTNNSPEQVMLGDFPGAVDDAVIDANESHQNQMMQYLNNREIQAGFQRVVLELLKAMKVAEQ
ncbi:MAG: type I restriction endonuclease [Caldilineaceae bacterium]